MTFTTGERAEGEERRWVAVAYQFDADGTHLRSESRIGGHDNIGTDVACERADAELSQMVVPILPRGRRGGDVFIRPFASVLNGVWHGLVSLLVDRRTQEHPNLVQRQRPVRAGDRAERRHANPDERVALTVLSRRA